MIKSLIKSTSLALALLFAITTQQAQADTYKMDTQGAHAFIQFKISHLGFSYLLGTFNNFSGSFDVDENNPAAAKVSVEIDTSSVDSNHAKRDKHLRSADFLEVDKFPKATFVSTAVKVTGDGTADVTGDFTLRGITKPLTLKVKHISGGKDPWGGLRRGFEGTTKFALADFGITKNLGPASKEVEIYITIEGIKQ
ncbi:MAG: YceI family protein [Alphaproteobacteria bacterium]|nr:YceI family protein [Rhodospirillales bacterium]MCW9044979.1 YceI family protein [Alphaproteobacteria bacterium]